MEDCVRPLEKLGSRAGEEDISRVLQDAQKKALTRCQPVERAFACARVSEWLSSRAMLTLGRHPCWEPLPAPTLSLLFFLVSHSVTFCLRAKAEAARAHMRWWPRDNPEGHIRRLFSWALHESDTLRMPAFRLLFLRCVCDCFSCFPNGHLYPSESGAEAHLMLAQLIFDGHADVSIAEMLSAAGSSNMDDTDGSSLSKGIITSSHVTDADAQIKEDAEKKRNPSVEDSNKYSHGKDSNTKRTSELAECLRVLEVAKQLVPFDAFLLKWRISGLGKQIELANFSLRPHPYHRWKLNFPFIRESSGQQDGGALNVLCNMSKTQIVPQLNGHWLYILHAGITMSLLFYASRKMR